LGKPDDLVKITDSVAVVWVVKTIDSLEDVALSEVHVFEFDKVLQG
jgi:hypothetical protein